MDLLNLSAPFFLKLDHDLMILDAGRLMVKAQQDALVGKSFRDIFEIQLTWTDIFRKCRKEGSSGLWFFNAKGKNQTFRSVAYAEENGQYLLLNNPVISAHLKLPMYNIILSDLPQFDTLCELVFVQQFSATAIDDSIKLNQELEKKNKALQSSTEKFQQLNEELSSMLSDVHHYVKNNMALIVGLLEMKRLTESEATATLLADIQSRVRAIGLVHETMYKNNSFARINLKSYIPNLVSAILKNHDPQPTAKTRFSIEEIFVDSQKAVSIALIINELVTNACKFAFKHNKDGLLEVIISRQGDLLFLTVKDNGQGIQSDFNSEGAMGLKIVDMVTRKMKGFYEMRNNGGLQVSIQLPMN